MMRPPPLKAALLAAALLLIPGCGRKTPVVPPQTVRPAPISDLAYRLDEAGVTLTWTAPRKTVQGDPIAEIEGFLIQRAVVNADEACDGCPLPFGEPIELDAEGIEPGDTVHYSETVLRPQHRYTYMVRTRLGWYMTSAPSNRVSFVWNILLKPPTALEVKTGDGQLRLSWQPPQEHIDGTPIDGQLRYQIYRSVSGEEFEPLGRPVAGTTFDDTGLENGRRYFYRIKAQTDDTVGINSEVVSGRPRDTTPPPPPTGLTAVRAAEGIKLLWQEAIDAEVAGYRIYRRTGADAEPRLLATVPAGTVSFVDRQPPADAERWFYTVTAFDNAEPANESTRAAETEFAIVH